MGRLGARRRSRRAVRLRRQSRERLLRARDVDGRVFHTYSCYARGLDVLNGAYQYLDLVPNGRDEDALSYPMEWVRIRDAYGD
jgi:predicted dithiol-disulfide oxidoreductase (DUF899 family)